MDIKRYKDFSINEGKVTEDEKYDIEQILADLTQDMGFNLVLKKVYYSDNKRQSQENFDTYCNNPVLVIDLIRKGDFLDESGVKELLNSVYEAIGRLSEIGEPEIKIFSLRKLYSQKEQNITIEILLTIDEKPDLSDMPGFYDFIDILNRKWRDSNNKVTRSFSIGDSTKDSILLDPKTEIELGNEIVGQATFTDVKAFIRKVFNPWHGRITNRTRREYEYELKKEGENVRIEYKGFKTLDVRGNVVTN